MLSALIAALQHATIGMAMSVADGQLSDANPAYAAWSATSGMSC
jgi:hypothetical protein